MRASGLQVGLVLLLVTLVPFPLGTGIAAASEHTPYPVILIHGIFGSDTTWTGFRDFLLAQGWQGGIVVTQDTPSGALGATDDFYILKFSNNAGLTFDEQALELRSIITAVRTAQSISRVILVGHSMDGLAARRYLEFHSRGDVAALITIGTPNTGAEIANLLLLPSLFGTSCSPGAPCTALSDLEIGSHALTDPVDGLNPNVANLPRDMSYTSFVGVATAFGIPFHSDRGDGIVSADSQSLGSVLGGETRYLTGGPIGIDVSCSFGVPVVHTCETSDSNVQTRIRDVIKNLTNQSLI